jgi:hypothetical protein
VQAGDSSQNTGADPADGGHGTPPSDDPLSDELTLPATTTSTSQAPRGARTTAAWSGGTGRSSASASPRQSVASGSATVTSA